MNSEHSSFSPTAQEGVNSEISVEMEAFLKQGKTFARKGALWLQRTETKNPTIFKFMSELEDFWVELESAAMTSLTLKTMMSLFLSGSCNNLTCS